MIKLQRPVIIETADIADPAKEINDDLPSPCSPLFDLLIGYCLIPPGHYHLSLYHLWLLSRGTIAWKSVNPQGRKLVKYYLYISDAKVDMLLSQIPHEPKKKIALEFG